VKQKSLAPPLTQPPFAPLTRAEMEALGWDELDVLLVTGDAYVDHPAFGAALLARWLIHHGFRTGIVPQPRWDTPNDVSRLGRPRLFCGVTAGSLDSMLAHYTAFRKKRSDDAYTPGGRAGARPNRAAVVYANLAKRAFPGLPVVLGGIEASLRRISHYDFWSDSLRRSIVLDAKVTAVLYGMAEPAVLALARALGDADFGGVASRDSLGPILASLPGAAFAASPDDIPQGAEVVELTSHEDILADPGLLIKATLALERQAHQNTAYAVQASGGRLVALTPPGPGLTGADLDALYGLPFSRRPHPSYTQIIPAAEMIATSINTHRGCAGGCSFCTLALHQGRAIRSRSKSSILAEAAALARNKPGVSISDVGGPSANMWGAACLSDPAQCTRPSCLVPAVCRDFTLDQGAFVALLRELAALPGVKNVRVASGWRMDLALADLPALSALIREFVGGQVKVAPEHASAHVLRLMRKPGFAVFEEFLRVFARESSQAGKRQFIVPYLMSAAPGCSEQDMRELADWLGARGWKPTQVQCFIPLPGTAAAAMYYAKTDLAGLPIHVAATDAERLRQHAVLIASTGRAPDGRRRSRPDTSAQEGRARPARPDTAAPGKIQGERPGDAKNKPAPPRGGRK